MDFKINKDLESVIIALGIVAYDSIPIRTIFSEARSFNRGNYRAVFDLNDIVLAPGRYNLVIGLSNYERTLHFIENGLLLQIDEIKDFGNKDNYIRNKNVGFVLNKGNVEISNL